MPKRFEIFNKIPLLRPKRNLFNLGYENKLSTDFFRLTPFMCKEALPDDVFRMRAEVFARLSPMIAPVMHRFDIRYYYFFVPTRIIWEDFEKWINPKSGVTDIVAPRLNVPKSALRGFMPKTLGDYLGVNMGIAPEGQDTLEHFVVNAETIFPEGFEISSLPFRAYQQIFNDWFIDLNNAEEVEFSKGSGVETLGATPEVDPLYLNLCQIRNRCWMHDYFTAAMPEPQRGPDVYAFEGSADGLEITGEGDIDVGGQFVKIQKFTSPAGQASSLEDLITGNPTMFGFADVAAAEAWISGHQDELYSAVTHPGLSENEEFFISWKELSGITADVDDITVRQTTGVKTVSGSDIADHLSIGSTSAGGVTVEELRVRMQMQSFLERNEIGGSRYTEMLYAHWGVKSQDGRLQRSEFIGGGKQPVMINEISQTSAPTDDDPLGQYAGQGASSGMSRPIRYRVPEHGYIIGLVTVVPRSGYSQGLEKMWRRFDRLDYYWPEFAHLGEQEVKNHEVLFSSFDPDGTFAYNPRYAEYKCSNDQIHGDLKGSLAHWHASRMFATPDSEDTIPKLSELFTYPSGPDADGIDRIFPVESVGFERNNADHFILDIYNHVTAARRMPKFVIPRNGS